MLECSHTLISCGSVLLLQESNPCYRTGRSICKAGGNETMKTKKEILVLILPVAALLIVAGFIYWLLIYRREHRLIGLLTSEINPADFLWCALAIACSLVLVLLFMKVVPREMVVDENVRELARTYSVKFMFFYFIPNAFYEELIFRGALQPVIGLIPAALLFTAVHVSYYKKPALLIDVFIQGILLGLLFHLTGSVWITTIAHTIVNTMQMWMIKKGIIKY